MDNENGLTDFGPGRPDYWFESTQLQNKPKGGFRCYALTITKQTRGACIDSHSGQVPTRSTKSDGGIQSYQTSPPYGQYRAVTPVITGGGFL